MNVLIIGDRPAAANQLRLAISAGGPACRILMSESPGTDDGGYESVLTDVDLIFLFMPASVPPSFDTLRQLRAHTDARIVAVGPADHPHRILDCLRAGADDFLDEMGDLLSQARAELERVKRKSSQATDRGRLIAVLSACGGIGATLTAANLSILIAQEENPCGLVDLTESAGDLAQLLSLEPKHSLSDLYENLHSLDREMLLSSLTEHDSGVRLIASAAHDAGLSTATADGVQHILQVARECLPNIVMDLDRRVPFHGDLLEASDVIVLLTGLNFNAACSTRRLLSLWNERGIPAERIVLVAGRCGQPGEIPVKQAVKILGRAVDLCLCDDALTANLSINCGHPLVLERPNAPLTRQLGRLSSLVLHGPESCHTRSGEQSIDGPAILTRHGKRIFQRVAGLFM